MKETSKKIVAAASQLFSVAGFRGTSIREIALRAGVSEITVFRHFPNKEELFWTAVESKLCQADLRKQLEFGAAIGEHGAAAHRLAQIMLTALIENAELNRLLYVTALELDPAPLRIQRYLRPVLDVIESRLRLDVGKKNSDVPINTQQAALALAALALSHGFLGGLFGISRAQDLSAAEAVERYCDIWLHGVSHERTRI